MTFTVRDLMLDVFPPAPAATDSELWLCVIASQGEPKPPPPGPPKPKPRPPQPGPQCPLDTQTGPNGFDETPGLASLAVLREQLQQALHP